jgi:hypothetical protein
MRLNSNPSTGRKKKKIALSKTEMCISFSKFPQLKALFCNILCVEMRVSWRSAFAVGVVELDWFPVHGTLSSLKAQHRPEHLADIFWKMNELSLSP